jgi:putative peptidoglycan lipid II flippase
VTGEPGGRSADPAADSATVAAWTLVSRTSGLLRVIVIGATLGPTFFANIFQATNLVPNTFFTVLAGWFLVTLLVPALVDAIDGEGLDRARELVNGFLGVVLAGFAVAGILILALGPLIVGALTIGIRDPETAASARGEAWVLLVLVVPQVVLYAVAAIGGAAQNARSRFALAAAAPTVENLGIIVTLLLAARWFGVGHDAGEVEPAQLVLLGVGTTLSVAAHATVQVVGARRAGFALRPAWGWRDAMVRRTLRRTVPSLATGALDGVWFFSLTVAAGVVPGGVVAFQAAYNFYNVPIALGARSVGTASLPRLSRASARHELGAFRDSYVAALGLTWLLAVPAGLANLFLARPLAEVVAFGELATSRGIDLLAVAIASLGLALIGASTFEIARYAAFARLDMATPLRAGLVRVAITLVGVAVTVLALEGRSVLIGLGVAMTIGDFAGAGFVHRAVRRALPAGGWHIGAHLRPTVVAAVVAVLPAALVAWSAPTLLDGRIGHLAGLLIGSLLGVTVYGAVLIALGSPDLRGFASATRRSGPAPVPVREVA